MESQDSKSRRWELSGLFFIKCLNCSLFSMHPIVGRIYFAKFLFHKIDDFVKTAISGEIIMKENNKIKGERYVLGMHPLPIGERYP